MPQLEPAVVRVATEGNVACRPFLIITTTAATAVCRRSLGRNMERKSCHAA